MDYLAGVVRAMLVFTLVACGPPPTEVSNPVDAGVAESAPPVDASVDESAPPVDASDDEWVLPDPADGAPACPVPEAGADAAVGSPDWLIRDLPPAPFTVPFGQTLAALGSKLYNVVGGGVYGKWWTWQWDGAVWTQLEPAHLPYSRAEAYMATFGDKIVLVQSDDSDPVEPGIQTWEWDGQDWTRRMPSQRPNIYSAYRVATLGDKLVLFGGLTPYPDLEYVAETWEWDGDNWTRKLTAHAPQATYGYAMASFGDKLVLVNLQSPDGDAGSGPDRTITWEFDGNDWTDRNVVTPDCVDCRMAPLGDKLVLVRDGENGSDDTWEWDGTSWNQRFPSAHPDRRKYPHLAAFDGRVVLLGGYWPSGCCAATPADVWLWDGSTWTERSTGLYPDPAMEGRSSASFQDTVVAFGGEWLATLDHTVCVPPKTWVWSGCSWSRTVPVHSPGIRAFSAMAPAGSGLLLFGGCRSLNELEAANLPASDTWQWDGVDWTELHPAHSPPALPGSCQEDWTLMTRFQDGALLVLPGMTWEWDGADWIDRTSPGNTPTDLTGSSLATWDGIPHLFTDQGGWKWVGAGWQQQPSGSPPESLVSLLVTPAHLLGLGANGIWLWDGSSWCNAGTHPLGSFGPVYGTLNDEVVWMKHVGQIPTNLGCAAPLDAGADGPSSGP